MKKLLLSAMLISPFLVFAIVVSALDLAASVFVPTHMHFLFGFLSAHLVIPVFYLMMDWAGNFVDKRREK